MAKTQPNRKVQPKLRMVANASEEVCALRAEHAAAVKVSESIAKMVPPLRRQSSRPRDPSESPDSVTRGKQPKTVPLTVSTFVQLAEDTGAQDQGRQKLGDRITARKNSMVTAELPASRALWVGEQPWAVSVELGQPLTMPTPDVSGGKPGVPAPALRRFGERRRHGSGKGVLIGLIDVGGFDFAHPDFLDARGKTRFVSIWDQGGDNHQGPPAFGYGSVITKRDMDRAIAFSKKPQGLPAHLLEPQSQMQPGSHGTHVASIAAGNRGVCREADVAAVLISIPQDAVDRRTSFYDSTRLAHAVDWLLELAGDRPISINISLGTNGHAHDDSSAISRWIDSALTVPGRSVCVAAGNAGQDKAEFEGDIGYILGRVHASGKIAARELVSDIEWNVVGNGVADLSENELEIWYGPEDRFAVQVKPPGLPWTERLEPGEFIENRQLPDRSFLSVYNELYSAGNGCNYMAIYLSPQLRRPVVGVRAGQWLVRLIGLEVRGGEFHCWIERDDPRKIGRIGKRDAWVFPSFFSERSFVDASTVSSLACGHRVVSVANLDEERRRINPTSSQGPTREGRHKPDIAAPGTNVVASNGFDPEQRWIAMSGTSMASPHVAGIVGLMLAVNPNLTGAQVSGIMQRTAEPMPGADFAWRNDAGSGLISPTRCLEEADAMLARRDRT